MKLIKQGSHGHQCRTNIKHGVCTHELWRELLHNLAELALLDVILLL